MGWAFLGGEKFPPEIPVGSGHDGHWTCRYEEAGSTYHRLARPTSDWSRRRSWFRDWVPSGTLPPCDYRHELSAGRRGRRCGPGFWESRDRRRRRRRGSRLCHHQTMSRLFSVVKGGDYQIGLGGLSLSTYLHNGTQLLASEGLKGRLCWVIWLEHGCGLWGNFWRITWNFPSLSNLLFQGEFRMGFMKKKIITKKSIIRVLKSSTFRGWPFHILYFILCVLSCDSDHFDQKLVNYDVFLYLTIPAKCHCHCWN